MKTKSLVKMKGTVQNIVIIIGLLIPIVTISYYFFTQPKEVCAQGCEGTVICSVLRYEDECGTCSCAGCYWTTPGIPSGSCLPFSADCSSCGPRDCEDCYFCSMATTTTTTTTTTTIPLVHANGVALYYYTGERVNGNVTVIPVENSANKTNTNVTNGEWSLDFNMTTDDVQYLSFIIDDNEKIGYNELKLDNDNPSTATLNCTTQNISLSGYSVGVDTGNTITSGNVKVSALDTKYINTTSFSGTWSIDFYPCLISGKIYTLQILVSDNTGKRGEILQKYPAK